MHRILSPFALGACLATISAAMVVAVVAAFPASGDYPSEGRNLPRVERATAFSPDGNVIRGSR